MDYLVSIIQTFYLSLIFGIFFHFIYYLYPTLETARYWSITFFLVVLHMIGDSITIYTDHIIPSAILGVLYTSAYTSMLFAGNVLNRKWFTRRNAFWFLNISFVSFTIIHMIGTAIFDDGLTLVNVVALLYYLISFCLIFFHFLRKYLATKNPIRLAVLVLLAPYLISASLGFLNQFQKLFGLPRTVGSAMIISINAVLMVGLGLAWAMDILDEYLQIQRKMAETDPLTGIANRRSFYENAEALFARNVDIEIVCIMLDLDHFKQINDQWGHAIGDQALQFFTDVFSQQLRNDDIFGRTGGEEFCLLFSNADIQKGIEIAERLKKSLNNSEFKAGELELNISASFGITDRKNAEPLDETLARADRFLYKAKETGRNRIISG